MGKRNPFVLAKIMSKGGPHDPKNSKQQVLEKLANMESMKGMKDEMFDGTTCPVCLGPIGEQSIINYIIGEVCSQRCLEAYWREGGKQ